MHHAISGSQAAEPMKKNFHCKTFFLTFIKGYRVRVNRKQTVLNYFPQQKRALANRKAVGQPGITIPTMHQFCVKAVAEELQDKGYTASQKSCFANKFIALVLETALD